MGLRNRSGRARSREVGSPVSVSVSPFISDDALTKSIETFPARCGGCKHPYHPSPLSRLPLQLDPALPQQPRIASTLETQGLDLFRAERQGGHIDFSGVVHLLTLTLDACVTVPERKRVAVRRENGLCELDSTRKSKNKSSRSVARDRSEGKAGAD